MFGYIVINEPELRVREVSLYRSYYCGMCADLLESGGRTGQLTLNYDTTFLALLLTSLYEPSDERVRETVCAAHPFRKHTERRNPFTKYAAEMTILLSWYSLRDDWEDEQKLRGLALSAILKSAFRQTCSRYPDKSEVIEACLSRLHELENRPAPGPDPGALEPVPVTPDEAGACFGDLMAELFAWTHDLWEEPLRRMGFFLGKFIYLLDAYDDLEKDAVSGSFNPLLPVRDRMDAEGSDFNAYVRAVLTMLMASCTRAFEALPIVENIDILRNILYAGVWIRFEEIFAKRTGNTSVPGTSAQNE